MEAPKRTLSNWCDLSHGLQSRIPVQWGQLSEWKFEKQWQFISIILFSMRQIYQQIKKPLVFLEPSVITRRVISHRIIQPDVQWLHFWDIAGISRHYRVNTANRARKILPGNVRDIAPMTNQVIWGTKLGGGIHVKRVPWGSSWGRCQSSNVSTFPVVVELRVDRVYVPSDEVLAGYDDVGWVDYDGPPSGDYCFTLWVTLTICYPIHDRVVVQVPLIIRVNVTRMSWTLRIEVDNLEALDSPVLRKRSVCICWEAYDPTNRRVQCGTVTFWNKD